MSSHGHDHSHDLDHVDKQSLYIRAPKVQGVAILLAVLGLIGLGAAFFTGQGERAWGSIIFNSFFFFCIALGGMIISACTDVISASWARPVRRIHEAFGSFVPIGALIFVIVLACIALNVGHAHNVYRWIANPHILDELWGKRTWLQPGWFYFRTVLFLVIITSLVLWQLKKSTSRDKLWMDGRTEEAHEVADETKFKMRFWSAPILICFGVFFTFIAFDITMSLSPTWLSTLWGGWSFAVMMQTMFASTLWVMFAIRNTTVGGFISRQQFHDCGKLMHGFTVFFGYLTFAHVLTYWYGNMPEETQYFLVRLHSTWLYFLFFVFFGAFVIPLYSLIPKAAKWTSGWTLPVAGLILFAQWITNFTLVMPELIKPEVANLPYVEIAGFFLIFGLFILNFLRFAGRHPMLPVADPLLQEALHGGH